MDYTITRSIFVTFDFVGFHHWPDAPPEVDYLGRRHRHLFKVRVEIGVYTDDRQVEYHMFKRDLIRALGRGPNNNGEIELGPRSCEQAAETILDATRSDLKYQGNFLYRIEVSEDGENGSIIEARM